MSFFQAKIQFVAARAVLAALGCATLAGCTLGNVAPDAVTAPVTNRVSGPPLQGSVYGGHAPLVGAHVYILQPSQNTNYGTSVSIAIYTGGGGTSPSGGGYALTTDSSHIDPFGNPEYFVTTDLAGNFNISNDYTCTPGVPVYLAATGGVPFFANQVYTFALNASVTLSSSTGSTTTSDMATFTLDTSRTAYPPYELFFVGESVTLGGTSTPPNPSTPPAGGANIVALGGTLAPLNGTNATVLSTGLGTTTFRATVSPSSAIAPGTYTLPAAPGPPTTPTNVPPGTVTGISASTANNNPGIVNMAYLGTCPASGATNFGSASNAPISFIYMNEVSSVALAYATSAFAADPFHIGANISSTAALPSGLTRGQYVNMGLLEAFNNASMLYDIQGSNSTTAFAGEGHIGRLYTPSGNGILPQAKLDSLGNIFAACVDSPNTSTKTSAACATLFANTSSTGFVCSVGAAPTFTISCPSGTTAPTETGTAEFNLAHFPGGISGNATSPATSIATLANLPTGNVPFTPNLTSTGYAAYSGGPVGVPSDWTLEVEYSVPNSAANSVNGGLSNSILNGPNYIALDGGVSQGSGLYAQSAWISNNYGSAAKMFVAGGLADYAVNGTLSSNNLSGASTYCSTGTYTCQTHQIAIDPTNAIYFLSSATNNYVLKTNATGTTTAFNNYVNGTLGSFAGANSLVLDASNNLFIANTQAGTLVKLPAGFTNVTVPTVLASYQATPPVGAVTNTCLTPSGTRGPATVVLNTSGTTAFMFNSNTASLCVLPASATASPTYTIGSQFFNNAGGVNGGTSAPPFGALTASNRYTAASLTAGFNYLAYGYTDGTAVEYQNGTGNANQGGMSYGASTAIDGAGVTWVGTTGTWALSALQTPAVPATGSNPNWLSPNAGFAYNYTSNVGTYTGPGTAPQGGPINNGAMPAIDAAGNVWLVFQGNTAPATQVVYEVIGVATPTWQPLAYAVYNSATGTRP